MDAYFSCGHLFFCSHMDNGSRSRLLSHVCKPGLCAGASCIYCSPFCPHTLSCFVPSHIESVVSVSFVLCCMLTHVPSLRPSASCVRYCYISCFVPSHIDLRPLALCVRWILIYIVLCSLTYRLTSFGLMCYIRPIVLLDCIPCCIIHLMPYTDLALLGHYLHLKKSRGQISAK